MPIRTLRLVPSAQMAASLIARAEVQAREGLAPFKTFRTGLPSLDAIPSWWGVTTIVGPEGVANRALAVRVALEVARTGKNVLWLCIAGNSEGAALRMVAGPAGIPTRRVFVDRDLTTPEWKALRRSATQFSRLPIQFADAHGTTIDDISAAIANASRRVSGHSPSLDLVVIDGLEIPDRAMLSAIERLAEDTNTPFLVVATPFTQDSGVGSTETLGLPLRRESLILDLRPLSRSGELAMLIRRVGRGRQERARVRLATHYTWLEELAPKDAKGKATGSS